VNTALEVERADTMKILAIVGGLALPLKQHTFTHPHYCTSSCAQ
jgi:hypothetical protein